MNWGHITGKVLRDFVDLTLSRSYVGKGPKMSYFLTRNSIVNSAVAKYIAWDSKNEMAFVYKSETATPLWYVNFERIIRKTTEPKIYTRKCLKFMFGLIIVWFSQNIEETTYSRQNSTVDKVSRSFESSRNDHCRNQFCEVCKRRSTGGKRMWWSGLPKSICLCSLHIGVAISSWRIFL